jgi:hypothetical protein
VQLYRNAEATEDFGHKGVCYFRRILVGYGVNFWPVRELVHGDQEIAFTFGSPETSSDIICDRLKGYSDVSVHQTPTPGFGTSTGGTGVTLLTPPLDVAP